MRPSLLLATVVLAAASDVPTADRMVERLPAGEPRDTAREVLTALRGDPVVAALLVDYTEMVLGWNEKFWADALLRSPQIPGSRFRVHDLRRPQPPIVQGRCDSVAPPPGAVVLKPADFTGSMRDHWTVEGDVLTAGGRRNNRINSAQRFGSVRLNLEFRTPADPQGYGQTRGNSGVFFSGGHEIQVLDNWRNPTYPDGMVASIYGQKPPSVNASLPPGMWQCLQIDFTAPTLDAAGMVTAPARATVRLNGHVVQNDVTFTGPTAFMRLTRYDRPLEPAMPIGLQDHGDAGSRVSFRNIWVLPK